MKLTNSNVIRSFKLGKWLPLDDKDNCYFNLNCQCKLNILIPILKKNSKAAAERKSTLNNIVDQPSASSR
jgi:hypothetical protein